MDVATDRQHAREPGRGQQGQHERPALCRWPSFFIPCGELLKAGTLRHLITIERPHTSKVDGAQVVFWEFFAEVWANIEQMRSFDRSNIQSVFPGADHFIKLRYLEGVTADMRAVYNNTVYSILGTPNNVEGRNRELILTAQSGVKES